MPAAWISAGVGVYQAYKGSKGGGGGGSQAAADPFASQRGQYQTKLQSLMNGDFNSTDPSYQWRLSQGLEGVNRTAAASGMLNSGNRLAQLMDYGQGQASQEFQNQFSRLSQLSGANVGSPSVAAQLQDKHDGQTSAFYQQLAGQVGKTAKGWWDSYNSGSSSGGGDSNGASTWGDALSEGGSMA